MSCEATKVSPFLCGSYALPEESLCLIPGKGRTGSSQAAIRRTVGRALQQIAECKSREGGIGRIGRLSAAELKRPILGQEPAVEKNLAKIDGAIGQLMNPPPPYKRAEDPFRPYLYPLIGGGVGGVTGFGVSAGLGVAGERSAMKAFGRGAITYIDALVKEGSAKDSLIQFLERTPTETLELGGEATIEHAIGTGKVIFAQCDSSEAAVGYLSALKRWGTSGLNKGAVALWIGGGVLVGATLGALLLFIESEDLG